mmetsp:Transcript_18470/g.58707  ORF Transcript_18470/g.58707 Transcript_18470/m.58707 type:complete len:227 (+) Transcript_18470:103-783(+)
MMAASRVCATLIAGQHMASLCGPSRSSSGKGRALAAQERRVLPLQVAAEPAAGSAPGRSSAPGSCWSPGSSKLRATGSRWRRPGRLRVGAACRVSRTGRRGGGCNASWPKRSRTTASCSYAGSCHGRPAWAFPRGSWKAPGASSTSRLTGCTRWRHICGRRPPRCWRTSPSWSHGSLGRACMVRANWGLVRTSAPGPAALRPRTRSASSVPSSEPQASLQHGPKES